MPFHDKHFPNEAEEYREARNRLLEAEIELRSRIEDVAAARRALPLGGKVQEDYAFEALNEAGDIETVRVSELFEPGQDTLVVYSFMYGPEMDAVCPMCTSFIDGLDSSAPHVTQRVSFAVVAKNPIDVFASYGRERGWRNMRLLSSGGNSYNADYWGEDEQARQRSMMNVFVRKNDSVYHFWGSEQAYTDVGGQPRHVDLLWPLWNLLDLTPEGRGSEWYPKLKDDA
jgi:predicted dithiol-disulfide oxidoreductase (DUF899 family)